MTKKQMRAFMRRDKGAEKLRATGYLFATPTNYRRNEAAGWLRAGAILSGDAATTPTRTSGTCMTNGGAFDGNYSKNAGC